MKKMKKKILLGLFTLALITTASMGVMKSNNKSLSLSDLALANIEALANGESASPCGGPKTYGECESRNQINCKDHNGCQ